MACLFKFVLNVNYIYIFLGQPAADGRQRPAGDAVGSDQHALRSLQPQRFTRSAADHPVPVVWRTGENEDLSGAL